MLEIADKLFFWLHISIILFNLLGWIWARARKLHLFVVCSTLFSWIVLGLKYGLGYCFITDWHWQVKQMLGENDLPASFVTYFLDQFTPFNLSAETVDWITGVSFGIAILCSVYMNFIHQDNSSTD